MNREDRAGERHPVRDRRTPRLTRRKYSLTLMPLTDTVYGEFVQDICGRMQTRRFAVPRTNLRSLKARLEGCLLHPERVLFLDVETTGLSPHYDTVTIIGWSFGGCATTMIRGADAQLLHRDFEYAKSLVTFNGIRFDTKFIARAFPRIAFPRVHLDLMYICHALGLRGGQKEIEKATGINVRDASTSLNGAMAVKLWQRYLRGDREALRRLILYNRADVAALGAILDEVVRKMNARFELSMSMGSVRFMSWSAPSDWRTLPDVL